VLFFEERRPFGPYRSLLQRLQGGDVVRHPRVKSPR